MSRPFSSLSPANRRGVVAMLLAMAFFTVNDTLMKLATERLPVGEVIFVRSVMASLSLAALLAWRGELAPKDVVRHPGVLLRSAFEALLIVTYVTALSALPLGETTAVIQTVPLLMTLWAAMVWKERVTPAGWLAVALGMVGALLIMRPSAAGVELPMLLAVLAAVFAAGRDLTTRRIAREATPLMIALASTVASAAMGIAMVSAEAWRMPAATDLLLIAAAAIVVTCANFGIILAYRATEMEVVSPFRFSSVVFAVVSGLIVWGHAPDAASLAGMAVVVAAGVYTIVGGRRRRTSSP